MPRIVREVGVHLADDVDRLVEAPAECRRCTSGRGRGRRCGASPRRGPDARVASSSATLAGAVGRLVVDDQHADVRHAASARRPAPAGSRARCRSGRRPAPTVRHGVRPLEAQRRDLLGDQADEKDDDAQQDQQHRRVRDVRLRRRSSRRRRPRRRANAAALTGRKIRSGLKIVITFSRIRKNRDAVGAEPDLRRALRAAPPRSARSARCSPP